MTEILIIFLHLLTSVALISVGTWAQLRQNEVRQPLLF